VTWGFIWLMVVLKIPILMLLGIVWWAVRQGDDAPQDVPPEMARVRPHPPQLPPRKRPRGPHGDDLPLPSPPRVRSVVRGRELSHDG
jgi:hypothetical protein